MEPLDDPRVRMAAERTLLAWIRTGLAVLALGFVLARQGGLEDKILAGIGVGMVVAGTGAIGISAWQYHRIFRDLGPATRLQRDLAAWSVWFAVVIALIGAALVVSLLIHPAPAAPQAIPLLPGIAPLR